MPCIFAVLIQLSNSFKKLKMTDKEKLIQQRLELLEQLKKAKK